MSISTTRINIHVIYIFHVYDKNVKNSQDVDSIDLLWINRHRQLIQLSIYIKLVIFRSISKLRYTSEANYHKKSINVQSF